jgi:hypothetical protein
MIPHLGNTSQSRALRLMTAALLGNRSGGPKRSSTRMIGSDLKRLALGRRLSGKSDVPLRVDRGHFAKGLLVVGEREMPLVYLMELRV